MINWIYNSMIPKEETVRIIYFIYHLKEGGKKLEEKS
jgi:hypothetical protein